MIGIGGEPDQENLGWLDTEDDAYARMGFSPIQASKFALCRQWSWGE
ncbi:hypothetical protein [Sphingomonas sp. SUN039]|nr:hypothetical protein [Sphingomonas sp. SUN039]UVO55326.1 hypothetical protein M0209_14770 [Sphingomonas sp. SUN039]